MTADRAKKARNQPTFRCLKCVSAITFRAPSKASECADGNTALGGIASLARQCPADTHNTRLIGSTRLGDRRELYDFDVLDYLARSIYDPDPK